MMIQRKNSIKKTQVMWWVDKTAILKKPNKISIALKSLRADEIKNAKTSIQEAFSMYHKVQKEELTGAELDSYNMETPELQF